jgi:hypothetical protein
MQIIHFKNGKLSQNAGFTKKSSGKRKRGSVFISKRKV